MFIDASRKCRHVLQVYAARRGPEYVMGRTNQPQQHGRRALARAGQYFRRFSAERKIILHITSFETGEGDAVKATSHERGGEWCIMHELPLLEGK